MITTYYLEMTDRDQLRPSLKKSANLSVEQIVPPDPASNRSLYESVGSQWKWIDRLQWTSEMWQEWVDRDELQTWIGRIGQDTAGYFELESQRGRNIEIAYLGLLPRFIGHGLGGLLLTEAIRRAWEMLPSRIWVHTCTLDHPRALDNYKARGMRVYRTENST